MEQINPGGGGGYHADSEPILADKPNSMRSLIIKIIAVLAVLLVLYGSYKYISGWISDMKHTGELDPSFKAKMNQLEKQNDSLNRQIVDKDRVILMLTEKDSALRASIDVWVDRVAQLKQESKVATAKVRKDDTAAIAKFYTERYPLEAKAKDTPVTFPKPVLISAAVDLTNYDYAKQELVAKDSILRLDQSRFSVKDSTIGVYKSKDSSYITIIQNKDTAINKWGNQYKGLQNEEKALKNKFRLRKVVDAIVIGVLTFFLLRKVFLFL